MTLQEYHEGWDEKHLWSKTRKDSMYKLFMEYKPGKGSLAFNEKVSAQTVLCIGLLMSQGKILEKIECLWELLASEEDKDIANYYDE